ncbi:MAG: Zn-ribbon domain-containing OB-fold protein, partial [Candidatus Bathyarchaeia archaeon]
MKSKISKLAGTEFTVEDVNEGKVLTVKDPVEFRYRWATGTAMGRFLAELKNGRIIGRKCPGCGRVLVPPRMFCEDCFKPTLEWVYVPDTGCVNTFSISHIATDASRLSEPVTIAVIELDGPSRGMGFLHYLGEVERGQVRLGLPVKAVWKPPHERRGAITDIKYFKPREA